MNDGTISASFNPAPQSSSAANPVVKIETMPPGIPPNTVVKGEVVANDQGKVSVQTDQGVIVMDADMDIAVGQKVSIKVQVILQNAKAAMVAELLNTPKEKVTNPIPIPIPSGTIDPVRIHEGKMPEAFKPVQAALVQMPDQLTPETLDVIVKTVLNLPMHQPLPPSLQDGFSKFQNLLQLLSQANFVPAQSLEAGQGNALQHTIVTSLQQLLQPGTGQAGNALTGQTPQTLIQLQNIAPGQPLSPNILVDIKNQLSALLQPHEGKYTLPAISLVLGQNASTLPEFKNANLIFMTTPQGQQLVGLMKAPADQALLPGTIFVAAFQPQIEQVISLPILSTDGLQKLVETFLPLHASLGDTWPALDDMWGQALAQHATHPELLAALRQTIPTPTSQHMPPAMLFFLSVLKNGMTSEWIGNKHLDALEKIDKAALLKTLAQDMQGIKTRMEEPMPNDAWRPLPLPVQVGDQLMRLQWFYRHPEQEPQTGEDEAAVRKKKKTRFLLNVPKTSVGDIQIDGLVQEKTLDLILRTENTLSSQAENAIRGRFGDALELTGIFGTINFQAGTHHYVHV
jgi:hypothetical protein